MTALQSPIRSQTGFPESFPQWAWWLFLLLLIFAPASTKMAGTGWFLLVCMGVWTCWRRPVIPADSPELEVLYSGARYWLYFCLAAFLFKAVGMIYWGDPWGTRHFDFRILLIALSLHALVTRIRLTRVQIEWLVIALSLASLSAITVSYLHAQYEWPTPSNRINWAGGLAMLACVLLPIAGTPLKLSHWRFFPLVGVVAYVAAILMSGARGAYLAFPWIAACAVVVLRQRLSDEGSRKVVLKLVLMVSLAVAAASWFAPKILEVPQQRIATAIAEVRAVLSSSGPGLDAIDTSIGARIYMWQRSVEKIQASPLMGYGREQRIAFIKEWGAEADAHIVQDQTHLHNEYINGMVDHGVFGLLSTLTYMVGLAWLAWHLRKCVPMMAMSIGGLAFIHIMMSFTDANSQTNNYSVMIGLTLSSAFFLRLQRGSPVH